ncbi:MAG TPA: YIP1 family protein [Bacilli bacterium]|nr:YIP1 family protein [Bacilli bacterium]
MAFCKKCGKELKKGETCSCEAEVKFCKKCGKKLTGNETCDCEATKVAAPASFDFVETMKEIKDDLIKSFKKPVSIIEENAAQKNMPKIYILLAIIALTFGVFMSSLFKGLFSLVLGSMGGGLTSLTDLTDLTDYIEIPYVKIILLGAVLFAISMFAYAVIMLLVHSMFKTKKVDFKQGLALTVTAYIPTAVANLVCAILAFLGLDLTYVLVLYLVINMFVMYNFAYAYAKITEVKADKFAYVVVTLVVIASIVSGLCSYVISKSLSSSLAKDMVDTDAITDDIGDVFNN